jgi:hypothetical protein
MDPVLIGDFDKRIFLGRALEMDDLPYYTLAGLIAIGILIAVFVVRRSRQALTLRKVAKHISFEWVQDFVLPDGFDGEIQIDHLLLTSKGLVVLDVKEAEGNIFGGNRMEEWTVISTTGRYTFRNPQGLIFDKVSAVRRLVPDVPVKGYILFTNQARFEKGRPDDVLKLEELDEMYAPVARSDQMLDAFRSHWEKLIKVGHPAAK